MLWQIQEEMNKNKQCAQDAVQQNIQQCNQYQDIQKGINDLKGSEILQIFNNQDNFIELWKSSVYFDKTMQRFCWRLQYIIGEVFLYIQNCNIDNGNLNDCYLLDLNDIHQLAHSIVEMAKYPRHTIEFLHLKKSIEAIYNNQPIEQKELSSLYGYCVKIWKRPIQFSYNFKQQLKDVPENLLPHKPQIKQNAMLQAVLSRLPPQDSNPNLNPRFGPFSVLRMPPNPKGKLFPAKLSSKDTINKIKNKINQRPRSSPNHHVSFDSANLEKSLMKGPRKRQAPSYRLKEGDEDIINLKQSRKQQGRPPKCFNRNWSLVQEGQFCQLYIKCETPEIVKQELEKKYGVDARWNSTKQIQSKMQALVAKVFKKFNSLQTANKNINKFRTLKNLIISSDKMQANSRKIVYRQIACIYQAMLNVTQSKKDIIFEKIIEIINVCKSYQHNA